jgi:hypothetical protein
VCAMVLMLELVFFVTLMNSSRQDWLTLASVSRFLRHCM